MCKLENIFIIDDDNKLCDKMHDLRPAVIRRIESNVCEIQKTGRNVRTSSAKISGYYTPEYELYDNLIIEHNNNYPDNVLWRWPRPDEDK